MEVKKGRPFTQKITASQRDEIFKEYVQLKTSSERWGFETRMAEKYGVHRSTIHRITHDQRRINNWLKGLNHAYDIASGQILENLGAAVKVQTDLILNDNLPVNMLGLKQNAAVDLMNRAGLKKKDEESNKIEVRFVTDGFDVNMPPAMEEGKE